nr:bifunctional riboflavin kinase/FAD synthetase [Paenibacillus sediminis]
MPEQLEQYAKAQVLAIGQFDGLHLGHAAVINRAVEIAHKEGILASVMTFHPHPKEVMKKGDYEGYLTPLHDKVEILEQMGVHVIYIVEFNDEFSRVSPQEFVLNMLKGLQVHTAVVGFDFRFGHRGEGNPEMLRDLGQSFMQVEIIPPFVLDSEKVSSSGIRKWLQTGNLSGANVWLGRCYSITGTVVDGEKRGRTIGFPTANLKLNDPYVVPAKGVYAVRVKYNDRFISGVMNIGVKPTFHTGEVIPSYEVHLLDFNESIYGQELVVELVAYIREERKFNSVDELIAQIRRDAEEAAVILKALK